MDCEYLALKSAREMIHAGNPENSMEDFLARVLNVFGRRGVFCQKTLARCCSSATHWAIVALIHHNEVVDHASFRVNLWSEITQKCEIALNCETAQEHGTDKLVLPTLPSEPLINAFVLLRAARSLGAEADRALAELKAVASEDGADLRLARILELYPIVRAVRHHLEPQDRLFRGRAAKELANASGCEARYSLDDPVRFVRMVSGRERFHCETVRVLDLEKSPRCNDCFEAYIARPFFEMFGLVGDLELTAKVALKGFGDDAMQLRVCS